MLYSHSISVFESNKFFSISFSQPQPNKLNTAWAAFHPGISVTYYLSLCDKSPENSSASNNHYLLFITILWVDWEGLLAVPRRIAEPLSPPIRKRNWLLGWFGFLHGSCTQKGKIGRSETSWCLVYHSGSLLLHSIGQRKSQGQLIFKKMER